MNLTSSELPSRAILATALATGRGRAPAKSANDRVQHIRRQAEESETIYYLYILDDEDHLRGLVSFRQLLMAKPGTKVADLMERDIVTVNVSDGREDVAGKVERYDLGYNDLEDFRVPRPDNGTYFAAKKMEMWVETIW